LSNKALDIDIWSDVLVATSKIKLGDNGESRKFLPCNGQPTTIPNSSLRAAPSRLLRQ